MPWARDRDTGELIGYSGPKQPDTIEWHQQTARLIWSNWEHGYVGGTAEDTAGWAGMHYDRIRELRALQSA